MMRRFTVLVALLAGFGWLAASVASPEKTDEPTAEELREKNQEGENWEGPHVPEIMSKEDMEKVFERSKSEPVFIFKHSTQCPINARAAYRINKYLNDAPESTPKFYFVKVIERRPVSQAIAEKVKVKHESPQILLIHKGKALWDTSHDAITAEAVQDAMAQHLTKSNGQ